MQNAFGEALLEVQQVNAIDTSASLATVDAHLDMLRPAISNYGGSVEVECMATLCHQLGRMFSSIPPLQISMDL